MMILAVSRRLPQLLELQRERTWQPLEGAELRDMTIGIVGLGSIGRAVADLATAFGCRVVATRAGGADGAAREPAAKADDAEDARPIGRAGRRAAAGPEGLPELLAESDFIVLAAPLDAGDRGHHRRGGARAVKPGAWLINVARGRLVDERALLRALRDGPLGGAVLDTFREEPLPADVAVLRPAERHRHAPHVVVERPGPRSQRRAVLRQPPPLRRRRAAAQRRRPERRVLSRRCTPPGRHNRPMQIAIVGLAGSGQDDRLQHADPRPRRDRRLRRAPAQRRGRQGARRRLDRLAEIFKPKKIVQADVTYVDLPAPPASTEGRVGTEELPAEHLARLRDSDALLHVVRAFEDPAVPASRRAGRSVARPRAARPRVHARRPRDGRAAARAARATGRHGTPAEREANEREEVDPRAAPRRPRSRAARSATGASTPTRRRRSAASGS